MNTGTEVPLRILPEIGPRVPGFVPRVAFVVVSLLLCFDRFPIVLWLLVGIALTGLAVVVPQTHAAWLLVVLLGGSQAVHDQSPLDGRFFVLLAGLHLLYVLAAQIQALPLRGWVQVAVFRRPLLRFLAIQIQLQAIAVAALVMFARRPGEHARVALPIFGMVGGAALVLVTLLLIVPLLREKGR